jgi:hypothetical protein
VTDRGAVEQVLQSRTQRRRREDHEDDDCNPQIAARP